MSKLCIPIPEKCPNAQCAFLKIAQSGQLVLSRNGYKLESIKKGNGKIKIRRRKFPF